jgi:glycosyltransferase involved in cell wall biosynthesis
MSRISTKDRARLSALAPNARLVFHNGCTDSEYAQALRTATALVTASRDEGFGIPLVESMSLGTPVVVSEIPIFREIGGEAALYANVDSPEEFARAVYELGDRETWARHSTLSREQAARYSWSRSASALLDVLDDVMNSEPSR